MKKNRIASAAGGSTGLVRLVLVLLISSLCVSAGFAQTLSIPENSSFGSMVGQVEAGSFSGMEGLQFTIMAGNQQDAFDLELGSGLLRVANPVALDYESQPEYQLRVLIKAYAGTTNEDSQEKLVTVEVLNVQEAPEVSTGSASVHSDKGATVQGTVNDNGLETTVAVQYSTSPSLPEIDPSGASNPQVIPANSGEQDYEHTFTGLTANTTYYYRVVGKNSSGTTYGSTLSFTTYSVPSVLSINLASVNPTNADNVLFSVRFTEDVSGVDINDFSLSTSNSASGIINTVTQVSASEYQVGVGNIVGDGFLRLDLLDNNTIVSTNGVALSGSYNFGQVFTIDNTPPTVQIAGPSYPFTQISPVNYTVTYSDAGSGMEAITLSAAEVVLNKTGSATGTIEVSGSGASQRTVKIVNISGDGSLSISLLAGTATDRAGNTAGAAGPSNSVIVDNTAPEGRCPANITVSASGERCEAYVEVPLPTYNDNQEPGVVVIRNSKTGTANASSTYPVGTTVVEWTFTDQSGNQAVCSTRVTVTDDEPPVINCPNNIVASADADQCSAIVNFSVPFTDNCSGSTMTQTAGLPSGSRYPIGDTYNEFVATDGQGNSSVCSFTVTVIDDSGPMLACASDKNVEAEEGKNGATVVYQAITALDNCSAQENITITQTAGLASGAFFPSGSTVNTFEAVDADGNKSSCSFTVTVEDTEAPYLVISEPSTDLTTTGPVTYTVTYSGATVITLTPLQVSLNKTGTANGIVLVSGTGNTRTVTINSITGNGSLGISIAAGTAADGVGNLAPAAGPSQTFRVDNSAPTLSMQASVTTNEDTASPTVAISVSDEVTSASNLVVSASSNNSSLADAESLVLSGAGANRNLVITPKLNSSGMAEISVTVTDEAGFSTTKRLDLGVMAVADQPVVSTQPASGPEDSAIPLSFASELQDIDGSEQIAYYQIENLPENANLSAGIEGSPGVFQLSPSEISGLTVTPASDFVGEFTLQIRAASRESSNSDEAISISEPLLVTVSPVNDAPQFSLDQTALVLEEDFSGDRKVNIINLTDIDNDTEDISFSLSPAEVGFVTIGFNEATGEITFTARENKNQPTPFTFTVTANDGSNANATTSQTFTLQINPINDPPVVSLSTNPWVLQEDFAGTMAYRVSVAEQPEDEAGETITYRIVEDLATISVLVLTFNESTGELTAQAIENQNGEVRLTVIANDGDQDSEAAELIIRVNPVDDEPEISLENPIVIQEGYGLATRQVTLSLPANEADRSFSYSLSASPEPNDILVEIDQRGLITIAEPNDDFYTDKDLNDGLDGFSLILTITEGGTQLYSEELLVVVENTNDAPEYIGTEPWEEVVNEGSALAVNLNELFVDADGDELSFQLNDPAGIFYIETAGQAGTDNYLKTYELGAQCSDLLASVLATDPSGASTDWQELTLRVNNTENEDEKPGLTFEGESRLLVLLNSQPSYIFKFYLEDPTESADELTVDYSPAFIEVLRFEQVDENNLNYYELEIAIPYNAVGDDVISLSANYQKLDCGELSSVSFSIPITIYLNDDFADIPTLFTPNSDGWNDTWNIVGLTEYSKYTVEVYDRRGKPLWRKNQSKPQLEWDGTVNGNLLPEGEYFFRITIPEAEIDYRGVVTIVY